MSTLLILSPGLSLKGSKKAAQEKNLTIEALACKKTSIENSCPASNLFSRNSSKVQQDIFEFQQESLKQSEALQQDKQFQNFQEEASQSAQSALNDPAFQEWLITLQNKKFSSKGNIASSPQGKATKGDLYIFVSFSMGEKALFNLANEATRYGATLVLRGFIEGSYTKTVKALQTIIQKIGQGILIDPELFNLFAITAVPTFVLAKSFSLMREDQTFTPLHDRLQGHVGVRYALESLIKGGDLKREAKALLQQTISGQEQLK